MLENVFRRHKVIARLRAGPFGRHLAEYAAYLQNRGHARMTVRLYLWAAEEFARWLASKKLTPQMVDESIIGLFLCK